MFRCFVFFALVVGVGLTLLATPLLAGTILMDSSDGGPGISLVGGWTNYTGPNGTVNNTYHYSDDGADNLNNDVATYTPGTRAGFSAGQYDVYVSWGLFTSHALHARYTVNHTAGATAFNDLKHTQTAAQAYPGSLGYINGNGSGWYYLGQFNLNASSTVVLDRNAFEPATTDHIIADGVMLVSPVDGRLIDEHSRNVTVTGTWNPTFAYTAVGSPNLAFAFTTDGAAKMTYQPLQTGAGFNNPLPDGLHRLMISWAANSGYNSAASYLIDLDGDGIQDANDTLLSVNQRLLANGGSPSGTQWSGFFHAGDYLLTSASKIILYGAAGTTTSTDLIQLTTTPEPSGIAILAGLGICGLLGCAVRRFTRTARRG